MSSISDLADSIYYNEFDSSSDAPTPQMISGWLEYNVGTLNTYLNTAFTGINPPLCAEESGIFTQIYLNNYYNKQARLAARGIINNSGNILEVRDADHSVTMVNRNEVSKVFRGLAKDASDTLGDLVAKYNIYSSLPRQVAGIDGDQRIY